jgi:hypothetical protein
MNKVVPTSIPRLLGAIWFRWYNAGQRGAVSMRATFAPWLLVGIF